MSKVLQVRQDMCRKFHDFRKSHRQATCHFGPAIGDFMGDEQVVLSAELHSEYYSITASTIFCDLVGLLNTSMHELPSYNSLHAPEQRNNEQARLAAKVYASKTQYIRKP